MTKRAAIYLRVSTGDQTTENQRRELERVAERAGWGVVQVYEDAGVSGAKGRDKRPAFDRLTKDAARRHFDVVMAWSVDRLGRSLQDLVAFLNDLKGFGVDLFLHQQGLDTTTPSGRAFYQMMGVFAEFEREMIRERIKAGLKRVREDEADETKRAARRNAKEPKQAIGRPRAGTDKEAAIRAALAREPRPGIIKIAKEVGVGVSVVQRVLKAQVAEKSAV